MDDDHRSDDSRTDDAGGRGDRGAHVSVKSIGCFDIRSELGAGGMGTVYDAFDTEMQRRVALKVLHFSLGLSESSQQRFLREAWIAGRVEHPNIIRVYSRGEAQGYHYLAMEYADGGSLRDAIQSAKLRVAAGERLQEVAGPAHIRETVGKFIGLAEALDLIHEQGFVHRDIKPQNILLSGEAKHLKLTDFGIAHSEDMARLTRAGDFIGTIRYMSPELIAAHRTDIDRRSDIYSLGVTLYEALTLTLPFEGDTDENVIGEVLAGRCCPARRRNPAVPRDLETVVLKAMHHDPAKRYRTAADMADDLKRILDSRPIVARREGLAARTGKFFRRHRTESVTAAAILVLSSALLYGYYHAETEHLHDFLLVSTLKQAVLSRQDPATFEPTWTTLSARLVNAFDRPDADSIHLYFVRSCALATADCPRFATSRHAGVTLSCYSLDLLRHHPDQPVVAAAIVTWEIAIDEGEFTTGGSVYQHIQPEMGRAKSTMKIMLTDIDSNLTPGPHTVRVKTITTSYWGALAYYTTPLSSGSSDTVVIESDTLYSMEGRFFGPGSLGKPPMFSPESHKPVQPLNADTATTDFDIWLFDRYPDNFPRLAHDESGAPWWRQQFRIDKMEIRPLGDTACETTFKGSVTGRSVPSLAMKMFVLDLASGDTLLSGLLATNGQDGACRVAYDSSLSSWKTYWRNDPDDSTQQTITLTTDMIESLSKIREASAGRAIAARLRLEPSQEVGRRFGDDDEIYGLPIEMDILFSVNAD